MINQVVNANTIIDDTEYDLEVVDDYHRKFAQSAIIRLKECGYKFLKSTYFTTLRHKGIYYLPHYFYATPEQKVCIIDIVILRTTLKKREQLITDFELLNRDCQKIRSILQKEYQNCSRIFVNESFGTYDYVFIDLLIYKKIRYIPIYDDSYQVIFSVKPLIVTEGGGFEFDLQQDSRVDIINVSNLSQYLQSWKKEVLQLGDKVYNVKKFLHHDRQGLFDKIAIWAAILWLIPTELNIFLMWHIWYLSMEFIIFVAILTIVSMYAHSFLRYKIFSKACKKEITSSNWIFQCNYLRPFTVRSKQLLVRPLENSRPPIPPKLETTEHLTQIFKVPQPNVTSSPKPTVETMEVSKGISNNQVMQQKVEPMQKEVPPPPSQDIPKPLGRGIRKLLARQPKYNVNLEVYKQQLGDLYTKLKVTTDFENFKQCSLKIITLILTCEWYKLTGNAPMNIRIKEVSEREIDYFTQTENLLRQFLDKYPDTLDVEETYRIATIINIGQLNQKTIEHIEWKIDDWLLHFKLLPEDKMKLLCATHTRRTTSPDKPTYNVKEMPKLPSIQKPNSNNDEAIETLKKEQDKHEQINIEGAQDVVNTNTGVNRPVVKPIKEVDPDRLKNEENQVDLENSSSINPNANTSGKLDRISKLLNQNEEDIPKVFHGDDIKGYYRFKRMVQGEGIEKIPLPLCILIFDSRQHSPTCVQEFIEVSHQNVDVVYYAIFDYNRIEPQMWQNEKIKPLGNPTIFIKDQRTGFEQKFDFNASELADTLAIMRESFKNKGSTAPMPSSSNLGTKPHEFEWNEEDKGANLMDLGDLNKIDIMVEQYPEIPKNIEQTAQIHERSAEDLKLSVDQNKDFIDKKQCQSRERREIRVQGLKKDILNMLSSQSMCKYELRKLLKGKHEFKDIALKELEEENKILTDGKKWTINSGLKLKIVSPAQDTHFNHIKNSVLEIIYGAFHSKKGPIVIFPLCKNCAEKFINNKGGQEQSAEFDLGAHLKLTNCDCPLPITGITREEARRHLDAALKSIEFYTSEGKYNFCAWRWKLSHDQIPRQELSWAIVIYMDPQNPLYNKERGIVHEFLKGYQFSVGENLKELLNQGLNQEELDEKFYEELYTRLETLTNELSTTINNNTSNT